MSMLITQPDHATLARRIVEHWVADGFPTAPRRQSIVRAVGEHDDGWIEVDASPLVDETTGQILDFVTAPVWVRQGIWPRGVERLAADPWAAALVAEHAIVIYARFAGDAEWAAFFGTMRAARARHLREAGLTEGDLARDYFFLRIADLASLAFCNGWTEEQRHEAYAIRLDGSRLLITPDPFGGRAIAIDVPARELPNRPAWSGRDAARAFREARRTIVSGEVVGCARR
jgi:hypothetical protein